MKKIVFHLCCGPCATASVTRLRQDGFEPVCLYANPNIHPTSEYEKRKAEARKTINTIVMEKTFPSFQFLLSIS